MKKASDTESILSFDPNAAALADAGIFGLPFTYDEAALVYLPVPWEVTTSYGGGTSRGPEAILQASHQVDLFDLESPRAWEAGLFMLPVSPNIQALNDGAKAKAQQIIVAGGVTGDDPTLLAALHEVNQAGGTLNQIVYTQTSKILADQKIPAIVGGDHSVPFGAFQAVSEICPSFGILHFDAHSDTRNAYEGFTWSHASIMYNALEHIPAMTSLVQVGIRDLCEEEYAYTHETQKHRVNVFFDRFLARQKMEGVCFRTLTQSMLAGLPEHVWISFDIDGLDPQYCPHTGTPVPGGLLYAEACYLIQSLVASGRRIIGFDLNEVAPDPTGLSEWDANVGARLLYQLTIAALLSQGRVDGRP